MSGDDSGDDFDDGAHDPSPFMDAVIKGATRLQRALDKRGVLTGFARFRCCAVFASHAEPNYSLPWQRKRQIASTSSGFIIEGAQLQGARGRFAH